MPKSKNIILQKYEITPINDRILIKKDPDRVKSSGGIILPDSSHIDTITGTVLAVSESLDAIKYPIEQLDKVLVDPRDAVPVDLEDNNDLFIIDADSVLAIFKLKERLRAVCEQ